ncbi:MAG: helix-turn-helix transcriptional regulator [Pseudomonadota bacterium]
MDRRIRAGLFRDRLRAAMAERGQTRSGLARATGADRSTLSQLLAEGETRLPNAHLVAECAADLGVSADWLLGLTERPERPGDLIAASVRVTDAARSSADDQLLDWHREAQGYKIRHVPATLPDVLKTEAVLTWEYGRYLAKTPDQAIGATMDRLDWLRSGSSDHEIALPLHEITAFAAGEGYYRGLDEATRLAQIEALAQTCRDLYPSLRLFFFDARTIFSAPITVFGPLIGVIYIGQVYLAFRSEERVRSLTRHFDGLIRECAVDAREAADFVDQLRFKLRGTGEFSAGVRL